MKAFVCASEPAHPPGEATSYHYLTFAWIVGGLIEAVGGFPAGSHKNYSAELSPKTFNKLSCLYL